MSSTEGRAFDSAKWTKTIGHLLANAADATLPEQTRQAYAAKAAELMTRHGIEEAHARASGGGHAPETAEVWPCAVSGAHGFGEARATIAYHIAEAMGCKAVRKTNPSPRPCMTHIVGVAADITALKTLIPLVLNQAELAAATRAAAGTRAPSYLAAFLTGYGETVAARIRERRKAYADASTGTDLILANRARAVADTFAALFAEHITTRPAARHRPDGRADGRRAGQSAYLGDSSLDATQRPCLPAN